MNDRRWIVQIFQTCDARTQSLAKGMLEQIHGLTVEPAAAGSDHYLIVESHNEQAKAVERFLKTVDPLATLLQAVQKPTLLRTASPRGHNHGGHQPH